MSPDEWNSGARKEASAQQGADPAWSAETQRFARWQRIRSDLGAFALGLAIIQLLVLVLYAKTGVVNRIDLMSDGSALWYLITFATDGLLYAAAGLGAALLGRRGYHAWPVALAFSLFVIVRIWTDILVSATFTPDFPAASFATYYLTQHSPLELVVVLPLLGLIGYFGVQWGRFRTAPRRATS
jgi:hypothetical protein